ncbi:hypothetical protein BLN97_13420 [Bradyrhizobium elkanii]|nr:hypothetical protein BLN97_13420 [Bradyrhizobium elkanii]
MHLAKNWRKASSQDPVEFIIRDEPYSSTKRTLIGAAVILLECTLVVFALLLKRDDRVEIQIRRAIDNCKVMIW